MHCSGRGYGAKGTREGRKECFGWQCLVHECWETKAARQIAQGHFLFLWSLGVKEAIFLRDNQKWDRSRGGRWRRGKEGGTMRCKINVSRLQILKKGNKGPTDTKEFGAQVRWLGLSLSFLAKERVSTQCFPTWTNTAAIISVVASFFKSSFQHTFFFF